MRPPLRRRDELLVPVRYPPCRPSRAARRAGFSLIEIMVALAILVMGAGGVYYQFHSIDRVGRMRLTEIEGRLLAQQELEELRACSFEELRAWAPEQNLVRLPDNLRYSCLRSVEPTTEGLLLLTVRVTWHEHTAQSAAGNSVTVTGLKAP